MTSFQIVGRSSSHFTRVVRIFALELAVPHVFRPVLDITSPDQSNYADNPALKVPIFVDDAGPLCGTENICRELVRIANPPSLVILRGDRRERAIANAEELTLHVMSTEVSLIMAKIAGNPHLAPLKVSRSIENCLAHLDSNIEAILSSLPEGRFLSFLEVALFCVVTHLPFREVLDVTRWRNLSTFCESFGKRDSALRTEYRFDTA